MVNQFTYRLGNDTRRCQHQHSSKGWPEYVQCMQLIAKGYSSTVTKCQCAPAGEPPGSPTSLSGKKRKLLSLADATAAREEALRGLLTAERVKEKVGFGEMGVR